MTISRRALVVAGALFALLAAGNLFLGGALIGRAVFAPKRAPEAAAVARFLETVPPAARPAIRQALATRRPELRARIVAIMEERRKVADLLRQPALDEAAVRESLAALRTDTGALQELVHELLVEVARDLPPEVRAAWRLRWTDGLLPSKLK